MTTARGEFELVLPADAEAGWTLAVTTAAGAAGAAISVIDAGEEGAPHDIEMPLTDAMIAGPVGNADVDIDGSAAASFEAFDVAAHGRARLLALAGGSLPPQRLRVARDSRPVSPIRVLEEVALQAFEHRLGRTPAESAGLGARREPADAFRAGAARFLARDLAGQST